MTAHAHPRASRVVLGDGSPLTRCSLVLCRCPGNGAVSYERAAREGETRADVAQPACMVRRGAFSVFAAAGPVRRGAVAQAHLAGDRNPALNRTLVGATSAGSIPATPETADWCDTAVTAGRDRRFLRVAHGSSFADSRPDSGIRITEAGSIPAPKISCVTGCCGDTRNRRITVTSQRGPVASKDTAGGMPVARPAAGRQAVQPGDADPRLVTVNATASGWGPPLSMRPPFSPEVST